MLGRVVVLLGILLSVPSAVPQCNYTPIRSAQFRTSALDLSINGNDLWLATSYGVSLYDRGVDPPRLVSSVAVPGVTRVVRAAGNLAYVGSGNSLVVVQKSGAHSLQVVRSVDTGGIVNDLVVTAASVYVATSNGLVQYDLLDPTNPTRTSATFNTSRTSVTSLALIGSSLYVADSDTTIEVFNISVPAIPQLVGSLSTPAAVTVVRANNGRLFASSALGTYVFVGTGVSMTVLGTGSFGTTSLAPLSGEIVFTAAADRRIRGVDFSVVAQPVEVFREELPPTAGSINRIGALASAGNRLYVAGGDAGLVVYDITGFAAPFPVRAYATGGGTSIVSMGDKVYIGRNTGGVTEYTQSTTGSLTQARSWDGSRIDSVWDGANNFLLTSSGASATMWTTASTPPQVVATTTFRAPVVSAVLNGTTGYAVLSDRTLWSADFALAAPTPRPVTIAEITPATIARSGSALVVADIRDDGTTKLAYFATGDFTQPAKVVSVPGLAVTPVTLSGNVAAVLTFVGITLVDFNSSTTRLLSNSVGLARSIVLRGNRLYELTDTTLLVWDTQFNAVVKVYAIPADPVALDVGTSSTIASIVTSTGVASVATASSTPVPITLGTPAANVFYKRIAAGAERIDLLDNRGVDIYHTTLRFIAGLRGSIVDVAANDNGMYTLSNGLVVTSYTADGISRGTFTIYEGADALPVSIRAVGDAVWVTITRGCSTFNCEKKTIVFDPRSGVSQTMTLTGGITDVVTSATRAYVLTDLPAETRVMNISDPFHPSAIVVAAAPASPVSIAYNNSTVYILGDKLTAYAESTLTSIGEILGAYVQDPTGVVRAVDQRVRIEANCAVVTGRAFSPLLFNIVSPTQWSPATSFALPSATRAIATQPGTIHFLTDHSLETWSTKPLPKPARRPPAR